VTQSEPRILHRILPRLPRIFCLIVGPFLVIDGITGLMFAGTGLTTGAELPHREWNWFFEFNDWHQILHVATGAILVVAALRPQWSARGTLAFGAIYLVLTPVAVIDGDDIANVIFSDGRDNVIHGLLALEGILIGLAAGATGRASSTPLP
jgi:uncharacterized protein DUF4383